MASNAAEQLKSQIRSDLKLAMREKRSGDLSLLRSMLGAIDNAEAVPVGDRHEKYNPAKFGDASVEAPRRRL
jgi:uncharacterized protein